MSMKRSSAETVIYAIVDVVNRYPTHAIVCDGFSSNSQGTIMGYLLCDGVTAINNTQNELTRSGGQCAWRPAQLIYRRVRSGICGHRSQNDLQCLAGIDQHEGSKPDRCAGPVDIASKMLSRCFSPTDISIYPNMCESCFSQDLKHFTKSAKTYSIAKVRCLTQVLRLCLQRY
jgi:hypothetical protein